MKQIFLLFCMTFMVASVSAQTDYSEYLNKAMEKLEAGDCNAARKFYSVYKELTGKTVNSVEDLITDCKKELHLGDIIDVNGEQYIVAYLMDNNKHGFAIRDMGIHGLMYYSRTSSIMYQLTIVDYLRSLPSIEEMRIIYKNNGNIGLTGEYWTRSVYSTNNFYLMDLRTGKEYYSVGTNENGVLLIHRF